MVPLCGELRANMEEILATDMSLHENERDLV